MIYHDIQSFITDLDDHMEEIDAYNARKAQRGAVESSSSVDTENADEE